MIIKVTKTDIKDINVAPFVIATKSCWFTFSCGNFFIVYQVQTMKDIPINTNKGHVLSILIKVWNNAYIKHNKLVNTKNESAKNTGFLKSQFFN